jgi:hypothetical protein
MEVTMQSNFKTRAFRPAILALTLLLGMGLVGAAIAQAIRANSDTQDPPVYVEGIAYGVIDEVGQALVSPTTIYPDDNPPQSAGLSPNAPTASFSYYFVSGAALVARNSADTYIYDGSGCVHATSNNVVFNTDMQLPVGSEIKYLRLYFYDANNPGYITGYISRYPPSQTPVDIVAVSSPNTGQPGAGSVLSQRITETVDYLNSPYLLIGRPSNPNANLRICGLRVAYYAPEIAYTFMPIIRR